MGTTLELKQEFVDGIPVVTIDGELDVYHAFQLKELVSGLLDQGVAGIVLDLTPTQYIDSSGVGALIFSNSLCKKSHVAFRLANPHGSVLRVIELTKLIGYLPIAKSSEEALSQIASGGTAP